MPKPNPREFREDVIRVARKRESGFVGSRSLPTPAVSESCLNNGSARPDRTDGVRCCGTSPRPVAALWGRDARQRAAATAFDSIGSENIGKS